MLKQALIAAGVTLGVTLLYAASVPSPVSSLSSFFSDSFSVSPSAFPSSSSPLPSSSPSAVLPVSSASPSSSPSADSSPAASPSAVSSSVASPTPSVVPFNKSILLREFLKAQKSEIKALEHRHNYEQNELKATQDVREKEWKRTETDARHKFFEAHIKGPERRSYIQDFLSRRDALHKLFVDERTQRKHEQEARVTAVRQDQEVRLKNFKQALEGGKVPPQTLWPTPGN